MKINKTIKAFGLACVVVLVASIAIATFTYLTTVLTPIQGLSLSLVMLIAYLTWIFKGAFDD